MAEIEWDCLRTFGMKGRRSFTTEEIEMILAILREKPRTKETRDKLRAMGFYISDFAIPSPFTTDDLQRLIVTGEITVGPQPDKAAAKHPFKAAAIATTLEVQRLAIEAAREKFRPDRVEVLLVGESPPAGGTFFYLANSILYRATQTAFLEVFGAACGDGEDFLRFFQQRCFYLDDLCTAPVNHLKNDPQRQRERLVGVKPLAQRMVSYSPRKVISLMKAIAPQVGDALRCCGACGARSSSPLSQPPAAPARVRASDDKLPARDLN